MWRRQTFVDEGTGETVVLPVTPGSYAWENGIHVETVLIDQLGDIHMAGRKALDTRKVECLFPARRYPFCEPEAKTEPFWYLEWFQRRCQAGAVLRYIVSGTPLNAAVLLESIQYSEGRFGSYPVSHRQAGGVDQAGGVGGHSVRSKYNLPTFPRIKRPQSLLDLLKYWICTIGLYGALRPMRRLHPLFIRLNLIISSRSFRRWAAALVTERASVLIIQRRFQFQRRYPTWDLKLLF